MDVLDAPDLFVGDLSDPWVAAIAEAMPREKTCLDLAGDWPDSWPDAASSARVIVLHRQTLSVRDAEGLRRLRARDGTPPKLVLCLGPHVRAADLDRWGALADVVLHEATASEVIARHVAAVPRSPAKGKGIPRVAVVSGLHESRRVLVEGCTWVGYEASPARDWDDAGDAEVVLWDVPVLEEFWEEQLAREAARRQVVALLGFADRTTVGRARKAGASACLDLPFDLADLAFVLDRMAREPRVDPVHAVPPKPMGRRLGVVGSRMAARDLK